ncbi:MAG: toll/interleukin-1 receptor domain-containing protein [Bifidobacteriaceae bacterium]|jgi:hypothetical protein|nr:toll/interleukin-1 receptor domain-containing protein [Bifidobacteriaceae bacterium]
MKVFISWSGQMSKGVAVALKEWIPSVIQAIEPFLSSEDIDKGSRWSTDIARGLQDSTFGIICVTKDNLSAPWLNFEAGALSKTIDDSEHVAPFLLDVKPSDLSDSPISQFQATSFNRDDVLKLVQTLNSVCKEGNGKLSEHQLEEAFDVWWERLKVRLEGVIQSKPEEPGERPVTDVSTPDSSDVLEQILEASRNTQRLLGNTDTKLNKSLDELQVQVSQVMKIQEHQHDREWRRAEHRMHPMMVEDALMFPLDMLSEGGSERRDISPYILPIALSPWKRDLPWLYDAASRLASVLMSEADRDTKRRSIEDFSSLTAMIRHEHPVFRDFLGKGGHRLVMELDMFVGEFLHRWTHRHLTNDEESAT